jgi:hypothetical protein
MSNPGFICANANSRMNRLLGRKAHQAGQIAMALERLQARAAAGVPDLDGVVVGRRRQPSRVVQEGHGVDLIPMALERLQARAPVIVHSWNDFNEVWLFVLEKLPN